MPDKRCRKGIGMTNWTLDTVHDRCTDDGDCWIWAQGVNGAGHPQASVNGRGGTLVRRVSFALANGPTAAMLRNTCRNLLCCNPEHLQETHHGEVLKEAYASGSRSRFKTIPPSFGILDAEKVVEILCEGELTKHQQAEKYGVSYTAIKDIHSGRTWKPTGTSVFSWRP